jgi:hypothetical protein
VFDATSEDSGRTNAPPTCWNCIAHALEECPMLQNDAALHIVTSAASVGVLADLYGPSVFSEQPVLAQHNVFVAWDAHRYHASALATSQVVELHGMMPVS